MRCEPFAFHYSRTSLIASAESNGDELARGGIELKPPITETSQSEQRKDAVPPNAHCPYSVRKFVCNAFGGHLYRRRRPSTIRKTHLRRRSNSQRSPRRPKSAALEGVLCSPLKGREQQNNS